MAEPQTDDIVEDILAQGRVSNADVNFAHSMLNAAGFSDQGQLLQGGPRQLPERAVFERAGVGMPAEQQPVEEDERSTLERIGRAGVMVLRAPVDAAANTIDQLDRLRAVTMGRIGDIFGTDVQQALGVVGSMAPSPEDPTGTEALGMGEQLEMIANKVLAQPETDIERGVNDVATFLVAMVPAVKALQAAGATGMAAQIGAASTAEFFALDPDTPSAIDAISLLSPEVGQWVKTYIRSDDPDEFAERTLERQLNDSGFRALFDGALLGATFEGFVNVVRLMRHGFKARQVADQAIREGVPRLQQQAAGVGGRVPLSRQIPPGRTGAGATQPPPVIEVFPPSARAPVQPAAQAALPAGRPVLALPQAVTPTQVVDEVFTSIQRGSRGAAGVTKADIEKGITITARTLGRDPQEVTELFRLGNKMLQFQRQGFRSGMRETVPTFTGAEGTTTAATDFWRRVLGPEDEAAKTLLGLTGLAVGVGGATVLGLPETESETTRQLTEAGIAGNLARAIARRLQAVGKGLDKAAERGAAGRAAAARGARQLVHDGPLMTDVAEEGTEAVEGAAARMLTDAPVRVETQGVRKDIHFGKIDTDEDVQSVLQQMSDVFEGSISAARRLGTPMQAEAQLARTMGMTVDDLHAFAQQAQVLPKVAAAANEMLVASAKRLEDLRTAVLDDGDELTRNEFLKQFLVHGKIQRSVAAIRAESGRTLGMYRLDRSGNIELMHSISSEAKRLGAKTGVNIRQLAEMTKTMTPGQQAKMARDMTKPTTTGALLEYWMNSILSGPQTAVANLSGSVLGMMMAPSERYLTAKYAKLIGGDAVEGEATRLAYGMVNAIPDAMSLFAKTLRTGVSGLPGTRLEFTRVPQFTAEAFRVDPNTPAGAFINAMGHVIRTPGRFLLATDDAAKLMLYRGELQAQALRAARKQGISANQLDAFTARFLADPSEEAISNAVNTRDVFTFTNSLNDPNAAFQTLRVVGESLQQATNKAPLLKLVLPFIRTPVNLATFAAERTPVINLLSSTFRAQLRSQNAAVRSEALTKLTMSGMIMSSIGLLSASGLVTGSGPRDPQLRKRLQDQGIQFNSIRVGNRWVSFDRADPLGMMFGTAADIGAVAGIAKEAGIGERDINNMVTTAVLSFANAFTNKTYLRGVAQTLDAIRGGAFREQKLDALSRIGIDTLAGGAVPNIIAQLRRSIDPQRREMNTVLDRFINRVPGWSSTLPAMTNDWGEPVLYGHGMGPGIIGGTWNFLSPYAVREIKQHPAAEMLAENDISYNGPAKLVQGVELTPTEHNAYKKMVAQALLPQLERLQKLPTWQRLTPGPDGGRAMMVQRLRNAAVRRAQAQLFTSKTFRDFQQRARTASGTQRYIQAPGAPENAPTTLNLSIR